MSNTTEGYTSYIAARLAIADIMDWFDIYRGSTVNGTWLSDGSPYVSQDYEILTGADNVNSPRYVLDPSVGKNMMGLGTNGSYLIYALSKAIADGEAVSLYTLLTGVNDLINVWDEQPGLLHLYDVLSACYRVIVNGRQEIERYASAQAEGVPLDSINV